MHQFAADMFGRSIVTREVGSVCEVVLSCDLERWIAETLGDSVDRFGERAHLRDVAASVQMMTAHIGRHPSQSSRIIKRSGQPFGFLEISPDGRQLVQREERLPELETKIDRALDLLARGSRWMQGLQCLLEAGHGLRIGRAGESLVAGVPQLRERLLPQRTPERQVREALGLLA